MKNPLVSVEELSDELARRAVARRPMVLADVRWTLNGPPGRSDYETGHLPGALYVDLESELTTHGPIGGRHPLPDRGLFQRAVRRIGISAATPVVVYDAATSLAASRLWWLLTDAGHPAVRVLDGGLAAWRDAGKSVESGPGRTPTAGDFVTEPGQRDAVDTAEIAALVGAGTDRDPDGPDRHGPVLVDVRAADRYAGENETVDPIAGHIPGAVSRPSTENLIASGRFRPPAEIVERFADIGEGEDPVLYCGSGITAAHTLLALESAGRTARIYPGSWSDWITDPGRPRATGPTP